MDCVGFDSQSEGGEAASRRWSTPKTSSPRTAESSSRPSLRCAEETELEFTATGDTRGQLRNWSSDECPRKRKPTTSRDAVPESSSATGPTESHSRAVLRSVTGCGSVSKSAVASRNSRCGRSSSRDSNAASNSAFSERLPVENRSRCASRSQSRCPCPAHREPLVTSPPRHPPP